MMTRTIKFNIKYFIEEYIYSIEANDEEAEKELLHRFNIMFVNSNRSVQEGIYRYIQNSKIANEYTELIVIQEKIRQYFKQLDVLLES